MHSPVHRSTKRYSFIKMTKFAAMNRVVLLFSKTRPILLISRNAATEPSKGQYVDVQHNNGITTISMAKAPVNSLNLELCSELKQSFENAVDIKSKGIILTSTLPTVFSAGLDIREIYKPESKRYNEFWTFLQDLWLTLYSLGIPTAAAINGASPAGGCLLSTACEYRVMVQGEHTIGFNETKLGIVAPKWCRDPYIKILGYRQAELALMRGTLFKPQEALNIELVDELAVDKSDAISKCQKYISDFAKMSSKAREATKLSTRRKTLAWLEENREWDMTAFFNDVQLPRVQKTIQLYVQSLKSKSK